MTDHERRHLVQANRHIAECKERIARQRDFIEQLRAGGHDTDLAQSMLDALKQVSMPSRRTGNSSLIG